MSTTASAKVILQLLIERQTYADIIVWHGWKS